MRAEENECQRERPGPANDPVLAFNALFGEGKHGSADLSTEGSAEGHNYVWCSPPPPYHNCAVWTSLEKSPLSTPDEHSLQNMREKFQPARKNPGRDHNLFPSSGSTRATPLRSRKFLARFALIVLSRAESEPTELRKCAFGPRSLVFGVRGPLRKWGAPYNFESGLRFILSALAGRGGSSGVEGPGREKLLHWPSMVCWLLAPHP